MKLFSPAKINLFLKVLRRRPDGYHDLKTVFARISIGDEIILTKTSSAITLKTDSKKVPSGPKNLVWRAAELLKSRYRVKEGVAIRLKKRIPVAAGLGGGSSNAASVLLGLNQLWKLGLSRKKLLAHGASLGSDIPFFVSEYPMAVAGGRGERLKKIAKSPRPLWLCVVKPPFGISTKDAYESLSLRSLTPLGADVKMLVHSLQKGDYKRLSGLLSNSLEVSQNKRVIEIYKIKKELLKHGAFSSLMSGSGSSVFGIFHSKSEAGRAARLLKKKHRSWQVFEAATD